MLQWYMESLTEVWFKSLLKVWIFTFSAFFAYNSCQSEVPFSSAATCSIPKQVEVCICMAKVKLKCLYVIVVLGFKHFKTQISFVAKNP